MSHQQPCFTFLRYFEAFINTDVKQKYCIMDNQTLQRLLHITKVSRKRSTVELPLSMKMKHQ